MIGAPDMAFPRMNNISFWLLVASFTLLCISLFVATAALGPASAAAWTLYPPLSTHWPHRAGDGFRDPVGSTWPGASSILGAINFITTAIFNMRAPGMTLHRMPLFVWSILVTVFLLAAVAARAGRARSPCCSPTTQLRDPLLR